MSYDKTIFNTILDTFENEDIKKFAEECIDSISEYIYHVPASSSGKYHPKYALNEGGLIRHTLALLRIMNHLFSIDCVKDQFTSRERDLLRVAGLMHDTKKSGSQEEFEHNKYTKFNHPLLAADEVVRVWKAETEQTITPDELKIIYCAIRSHMGQFNTDKRNPGIELPTPKTKYEIIIHVCDYLASRKDIELKFDDGETTEKSSDQEPLPDINAWTLPFGKYKGKTLPEIKAESPGYIKWAKENANSEPFKSLVAQI